MLVEPRLDNSVTRPARSWIRLIDLASARFWTCALTVAVVVLSCFLWSSSLLFADRLPIQGPHLWGITLLFVFAATEMLVMHVQVRREARTISLSDTALVVGLFFADPVNLLAARVLGTVLVLVLVRRQHPLKVAFNAACLLVEVWVAVTVFRWALGPAELGVRSWFAAVLAVACSGAVTAALVTLVIALNEDLARLKELGASMLSGAAVGAAVSIPSLLAVEGMAFDGRSAFLTFGLLVLWLFGHRKYAELSRRHVSLERLYDFTRVLSSTPEVDALLTSLAEQGRTLVHGQHSEVVLFVPDGQGGERCGVVFDLDENGNLRRTRLAVPRAAARQSSPVQAVMSGADPMLVPRSATGDDLDWMQSRGFTEALVVPLRSDGIPVGVLVVADRLGEVTRFDGGDLRLVETLANHAAVALENGRLLERLRHEALHDALTGLPNRLALNRFLHERVGELKSSGEGFSVLVMDLDGFKEVNDALGHTEGDTILCVAGQRLVRSVGQDDMVARLGGDEFAAVLVGVTDEEEALSVGHRIAESLSQVVSLGAAEVHVRASMGVAIAPHHGLDSQALLRFADLAMYGSKKQGGGITLYDSSLVPVAPALLTLTSDFKAALERPDELLVYMQPQARLSDGRVTGAEALVRWQHPRDGLMNPDSFIPIAERYGLVTPLTFHVLNGALAALALWPKDNGELRVAVNLSAKCLFEEHLATRVDALLERHGIAADRLTLEVTESSVMTDPVRALRILKGLNEMGVRLSVDDFGTGYSSLSYLKRLPVHEVKVDKGFIHDLVHNAGDLAIVRSIIDLGSNLGLEVVAEGVEDVGTWDLLLRLGCTLAQGYGLARPMPAEAMPGWLHAYDPERYAEASRVEGVWLPSPRDGHSLPA